MICGVGMAVTNWGAMPRCRLVRGYNSNKLMYFAPLYTGEGV